MTTISADLPNNNYLDQSDHLYVPTIEIDTVSDSDSEYDENQEREGTEQPQEIEEIEQDSYANNGYIGEEIKEKPDGCFRVFGKNPDGITLGHDGGEFADWCTEMAMLQVDSWGIYELNLDTQRPAVKDILFNTVRRDQEHNRLVFGSSTIPSRKSNYKPGGVLLATTGRMTGRVVRQGTDRMGRWAFQIFAGTGGKLLTLITAYQVCQQAVVEDDKIKSFTCSAQQVSMLRQEGRYESPRDAFIQDMICFIREQQNRGSDILLFGNFNEPLQSSNSGMGRVALECNLYDIMEQAVGQTDFGTYARGSNRIDYALGTANVLEHYFKHVMSLSIQGVKAITETW